MATADGQATAARDAAGDSAATSAKASAKKKKVPAWYYAAGGGALLVLYYVYSNRKAAASSSSSSSAVDPNTGVPYATELANAQSNSGTSTGSYGNAGDLSALAPYLANLSGQAATTGTAAPPQVAYTAPTGETLVGGGYVNPTGSQTPITDATGSKFDYIATPAQLTTFQKNGGTVYYQPQPGVFSPVTGALSPGTPQFQKV